MDNENENTFHRYWNSEPRVQFLQGFLSRTFHWIKVQMFIEQPRIQIQPQRIRYGLWSS
jgi:hypothetical protein